MELQYLGHSCIKLKAENVSLLIDPFLTGNATAPFGWEEAARGVTHILLTHGHADHVGDTIAIAKENNISAVAIVELAAWLGKQGLANTIAANFGGTVKLGPNVSVTLVPAWHTSAADDGTYLGEAAGLIIKMGDHSIYHAGDTAIFGDMALINELYQPTVVLLPIGGNYTMDSRTAAIAAQKYFSSATTIIPLHYATFPVLEPTAANFVEECATRGLTATPLKPGEVLKL
jgi:L-ascorbate metabolism protein UlaG (beta-lactamase superfamily)